MITAFENYLPFSRSRKMWRIPAIITTVLLVAACSNMAAQKRMENLDDALDSYGAALRWAHYQDVLAYHLNQDGKRPVIEMDKLDDYSVTGFEITERVLNEDQSEAFIKSELVYYHKEYGTVRKLRLNQNWWYSEEAKHWFVETAFPEFK